MITNRKQSLTIENIANVLEMSDLSNREQAMCMGLELKTIPLSVRLADGGAGTLPVVDFEIVDGAKVLSSLRTLDANKMDTGLLRGLRHFAARLEVKILGEYDLSDPDDEFYNAIAVISEIADELDRLGLGSNAHKLRLLDRSIKQGFLKEYKAAVNAQIFDPDFGPATWDINLPPRALGMKWEKACHALEAMRSNKRSESLFAEAKTQLENGAFIALHAEPDDSKLPSSLRPISVTVLQQALVRLKATNWR